MEATANLSSDQLSRRFLTATTLAQPQKLVFSVINVINHLLPVLRSMHESRQLSEEDVKAAVDHAFNYVKTSLLRIATPTAIGNLVHLQFMPVQAEQQLQGDDFLHSRKAVREHMMMSVNKNQVVTFDLNTLETLHQFGAKPFPFAHAELQLACQEAFNDLRLNGSQQPNPQQVKVSFMPVGLQFQVCWCFDRWMISSKTFPCINDQKAEDKTMEELLEQHLNASGVGMQAMVRTRIYTFLLSRKEFNKWIPVPNQLYLLSVFDGVTKGAIEDDPIKQSRLPRIYSTSFKCSSDTAFKQFRQMFQSNCNPLDGRLSSQLADKPIATIIIKNPSGSLFELETECGLLVKHIHKWERDGCDVSKCVQEFADGSRYVQHLLGKQSVITRDMFRRAPPKDVKQLLQKNDIDQEPLSR